MDERNEILELLRKTELSVRRQTRMARIMCLIAGVTAVCCIVAFVMILGVMENFSETLPRINSVITQMETVMGNLETTTQQLANADLEGMVADVNTLVETSQTSLESTMEKLDTIDFEALNDAVVDLAAVVEPLADFINSLPSFGR